MRGNLCAFIGRRPPHYTSRIAKYGCAFRYTASDHRACSNHGTLADRKPWQDHCPPPDRRTGFNAHPEETLWVLLTARILVVSKGDVWPNENVIFKADAVPKLDAGLYRHPVTDYDIALNEHLLADIAVGTDTAPTKDMSKTPYSGVRANRGIGLHSCVFIDEGGWINHLSMGIQREIGEILAISRLFEPARSLSDILPA